MALNRYLQDVQTFIRDSKQDLLDPGDIINSINRARRDIAMQTNSIRRLTPITGAVITASVVSGGSAYSNSPTITISDPDFPSGTGPFPTGDQATASAIVQGGTIAAVQIDYGGAGYWQPTATVTDASGSSASVTLAVSSLNQLEEGREVLNFSDIDLTIWPGVEAVYGVQGASIIYSNFRYSLPCYSFSNYQALIRTWANGSYQYTPAVMAQYGQGVDGSLYFYPLPSQALQCELDCYCMPSDLVTELSYEALPAPWTDAVAYWATHLSFLQIQNYNAAKFWSDMYDKQLLKYSRASRVSRVVNPMGRYGGGW